MQVLIRGFMAADEADAAVEKAGAGAGAAGQKPPPGGLGQQQKGVAVRPDLLVSKDSA